MENKKVLLSIQNLQKYFPIKKKHPFQLKQDYVKANKNISLDIYEGETLGIVGESGCGKSTFGRTIIQLQRQTGGSSLYYGEHIDNFMPKYVKKVYKSLEKVSQNYDKDSRALKALKNEIHNDETYDKYRLKKIEFANKYYNTFRLIGGLASHENLKLVKKFLLKRYASLAKIAKANRKIQLEKAKIDLHPNRKSDLLVALQAKVDSYQNDLKTIEIQLFSIKEDLKREPKFQKYEKYLDDGIDLSALTAKEIRQLKKDLQIIFQDPYSSLDPRQKVSDIIGEGLLIHKFFKTSRSKAYENVVLDIMNKCGLDSEYVNRYPHQFSGGQRQRIGIARALALKPKFIVCDEAVSALDVSIQSQVINLLQDLKKTDNLTYLFITHDLGVVRYISDRIGVMYFGSLVELAPAEAIFNNPQHPYTRQLLNAIPELEDEDFQTKQWEIRYDTEDFSFDFQSTNEADPDWHEVSPGHFVACKLKRSDYEAVKGEVL